MHCCGHESGHSQAHVMFLSDATDVDDEDAAADEEKEERLHRCRAGIVIRRPLLYAARIIVIVFAIEMEMMLTALGRSQLTST